MCFFSVFFFFKQKTAYEMRISDWSSDVCSSDLNRALGGDDGARARSLAALKRAREKERRSHTGPREAQAKQVRDVIVPETITVQELANRMAEKGADLVKALFKMGMAVTVNQTIDQDTAELLVTEFGHNVKRVSESDIDLTLDTAEDSVDALEPRAPVVTIMGRSEEHTSELQSLMRISYAVFCLKTKKI